MQPGDEVATSRQKTGSSHRETPLPFHHSHPFYPLSLSASVCIPFRAGAAEREGSESKRDQREKITASAYEGQILCPARAPPSRSMLALANVSTVVGGATTGRGVTHRRRSGGMVTVPGAVRSLSSPVGTGSGGRARVVRVEAAKGGPNPRGGKKMSKKKISKKRQVRVCVVWVVVDLVSRLVKELRTANGFPLPRVTASHSDEREANHETGTLVLSNVFARSRCGAGRGGVDTRTRTLSEVSNLQTQQSPRELTRDDPIHPLPLVNFPFPLFPFLPARLRRPPWCRDLRSSSSRTTRRTSWRRR